MAVQARSAATRRRILDATLQLMVGRGPHAVSHRAVSEIAGVSLGAITYHFGSKADLLDQVYREHLSTVRERARAAVRGGRSEGPVHARRNAAALLQYVERDLDEGRDGTLAAIELSLSCARDPSLRRRLRSQRAGSTAFAVELFRQIGSRNPEIDSRLVIAALTGLKLDWLAEGRHSAFSRRLPELIERLAELLLPET
jgi:TetR/AcrR family transcriptional regulator, regulator of biofilm formation and stress response